jgi:hypothetical protein
MAEMATDKIVVINFGLCHKHLKHSEGLNQHGKIAYKFTKVSYNRLYFVCVLNHLNRQKVEIIS